MPPKNQQPQPSDRQNILNLLGQQETTTTTASLFDIFDDPTPQKNNKPSSTTTISSPQGPTRRYATVPLSQGSVGLLVKTKVQKGNADDIAAMNPAASFTESLNNDARFFWDECEAMDDQPAPTPATNNNPMKVIKFHPTQIDGNKSFDFGSTNPIKSTSKSSSSSSFHTNQDTSPGIKTNSDVDNMVESQIATQIPFHHHSTTTTTNPNNVTSKSSHLQQFQSKSSDATSTTTKHGWSKNKHKLQLDTTSTTANLTDYAHNIKNATVKLVGGSDFDISTITISSALDEFKPDGSFQLEKVGDGFKCSRCHYSCTWTKMFKSLDGINSPHLDGHVTYLNSYPTAKNGVRRCTDCCTFKPAFTHWSKFHPTMCPAAKAYLTDAELSPHRCDTCEVAYKSVEMWDTHEKHCSAKLWRHTFTHVDVEGISWLKTTEQIYNGCEGYICSLCGHQCGNKKDVLDHSESHQLFINSAYQEDEYGRLKWSSCSTCQLRFETAKGLSNHYQCCEARGRFDSNPNPDYKCVDCRLAWDDEAAAEKHKILCTSIPVSEEVKYKARRAACSLPHTMELDDVIGTKFKSKGVITESPSQHVEHPMLHIFGGLDEIKKEYPDFKEVISLVEVVEALGGVGQKLHKRAFMDLFEKNQWTCPGVYLILTPAGQYYVGESKAVLGRIWEHVRRIVYPPSAKMKLQYVHAMARIEMVHTITYQKNYQKFTNTEGGPKIQGGTIEERFAKFLEDNLEENGVENDVDSIGSNYKTLKSDFDNFNIDGSSSNHKQQRKYMPFSEGSEFEQYGDIRWFVIKTYASGGVVENGVVENDNMESDSEYGSDCDDDDEKNQLLDQSGSNSGEKNQLLDPSLVERLGDEIKAIKFFKAFTPERMDSGGLNRDGGGGRLSFKKRVNR